MPFLTSALVGAGISAAGSVAAGAIGANAAGNAADAQTQAANNAANLTQQNAQAATNFNEQALNLQEQNTAPYRAVGQNAILAQNDLMGLTPINPYPINAGGNTAPTVAGPNGTGASSGSINNPTAVGPYPGAPVGPSTAPPSTTSKPPRYMPMPGLAKGGTAHEGQHYLVGEQGPEELIMHSGTGTVVPNPSLKHMMIPRVFGGPVQGNPGAINGGQSPILQQPSWSANPPQDNHGAGDNGAGQGPIASTGARPATPPGTAPPNPYGAQSGNPLITGGSSTPIQQTPYTQWSQQFQAPTAAQAEQYPGYQFQLQQGEQALANQASASGELGDSNYGRALTNYAENAATQDYGNVYNQALGQYQQNYNIFENNQANQFNRLASLAGAGQTSTSQLGGSLGQAANTNAGILGQASGQIGQQLNNAGAATASGYVGQANAYGGALQNLGNAAQLPLYMQYLNNQQNNQVPIDRSWMPQNPTPGQPYYPS